MLFRILAYRSSDCRNQPKGISWSWHKNLSKNHQINDSLSSLPREDSPGEQSGRRRYTAPRILSIEPLELAAAACTNPAQGVGKEGTPGCVPPFGF